MKKEFCLKINVGIDEKLTIDDIPLNTISDDANSPLARLLGEVIPRLTFPINIELDGAVIEHPDFPKSYRRSRTVGVKK